MPLPVVAQHDRSFPPERVGVRLANHAMPDSCERMAIMQGSGDANWTDETDMLKKLTEEAGSMGANYVHIQSVEEPGELRVIAGAIGDVGLAVTAAVTGGYVGGSFAAKRRVAAIAYHCPTGAQ
jgi:hypothetical protein